MRRSVVAICLWLGFCSVRTPDVVADEESNLVVIGESDDSASPITTETIVGEWSGLLAERQGLVTLRVHASGRATLAVANQHDAKIQVQVHHVDRVDVRYGRFRVRTGNLVLEGTARRSWGSGWGEGWLTTGEKGGSRRERVYFFYLRERSWPERMLELYASRPPRAQ